MRLRAGVLALLVSVTSFAQTTIHVPADQPTIQAGINAANNGDTVVVAPGTYFETISFAGKNISVTSSNGPGSTAIDGGGIGRVVTFNQGEGPGATLAGFTVQNGQSQLGGGGVFINNASPTIVGNVITGNHAIYGIGIDVEGGSPLIQNNVITGNTQCCGSSGFGGGGINVMPSNAGGPTAPHITGNTITSNSETTQGGNGGGINVSGSAAPLIENNYVAGNSATNGGGMSIDGHGAAIVRQNILTGNTAGGGGAISFSVDKGNVVILNNTMYGDSAGDGFAEVLYSSFSSFGPAQAAFTGNVIVATTGTAFECSGNLAANTSHNLVFSFNGAAWAGACSASGAANGNVVADPLFVDAANGNLHVQSGSPAIGMGDPNAPNLPTTDYDGGNRFTDVSSQCSFSIDAGVYETNPAAHGTGAFNPFTFTYPDQLIGTTSAAQAFQLTNTSSACLRVAGQVMINGDFAIAGSTCGVGVPPGQSCAVSATFSPTALGNRSGMLAVFVSGAGSPFVSLIGNGVAAQASVTPTSLSFGNQTVNTTSAPQSISLTNTGTAPLTISSISVGGSFNQTNNCGTSVPAGAGCTIQVTFSPGNNVGAQSSSVVIASNSQVPTPNVSVTGTGVAPQATLSPSALTFSGQALGTTSAAQTVTLQNTGSGGLTLSGFTVTGDFGETDNCPASLAQGASCTLQVTFTPHEVGSRGGSLTAASNSVTPVSPVALSGTGNAAEAVVSPASLSFNQVVGTTSSAQTVTLSNPGNIALSITSIAATSPFAQTNNCGASLAAGANCTISVTYSPTNVGTNSGSVTITDNAYQNPTQTVTLSGTSGQPTVSVTPASLSFPVTIVGGSSAAQTVTVTNTGSTYPLTISGISINNQQFHQTNNCPAQLVAGQSCSIAVTATPTVTGPFSATLSVADNAIPPNPQSVSLSGSGGLPAASVSPGSLSFATAAVGAQSAASAVTLSNTGTVAMAISSIATSGDFVQSNNCGTSLAAGTSCTINVSFAPAAAGTRTGQLTVTDNSSPATQTVSLSGSAVDFTIGINQTSVSINAGQTASFDVQARSVNGTYPTSIALSCSGAPAGSTCTVTPATLSAGQNAKLKVVTTKGATPSGTYVITATGTSNGVSRSDTATLVIK